HGSGGDRYLHPHPPLPPLLHGHDSRYPLVAGGPRGGPASPLPCLLGGGPLLRRLPQPPLYHPRGHGLRRRAPPPPLRRSHHLLHWLRLSHRMIRAPSINSPLPSPLRSSCNRYHISHFLGSMS
ncbi:unnamed protein product, partial [Musa hybrid cultivar]